MSIGEVLHDAFTFGTYMEVCVDGKQYLIGYIDYKTAVFCKSLYPTILNLRTDLYMQQLGDSEVLKYIPKQHVV